MEDACFATFKCFAKIINQIVTTIQALTSTTNCTFDVIVSFECGIDHRIIDTEKQHISMYIKKPSRQTIGVTVLLQRVKYLGINKYYILNVSHGRCNGRITLHALDTINIHKYR